MLHFFVHLQKEKEKEKLSANSQKAVHCPAEAAEYQLNYY